ncbi:hypothetical protein BaRGS_00032257 [Batillaria attramentaria]|uniref:Secreted protein n=1 Tax=Batillaria attramentaria TaxID=370345 RepID=A0ABD0JN94_9CAEN
MSCRTPANTALSICISFPLFAVFLEEWSVDAADFLHKSECSTVLWYKKKSQTVVMLKILQRFHERIRSTIPKRDVRSLSQTPQTPERDSIEFTRPLASQRGTQEIRRGKARRDKTIGCRSGPVMKPVAQKAIICPSSPYDGMDAGVSRRSKNNITPTDRAFF